MSISYPTQPHLGDSKYLISQSFRDHLEGDLCPVCAQHVPDDPRNTYCSEKCRIIAYNFRKRTSEVRAFLRELDFSFVFQNGVQLVTWVPGSMHYAYPDSIRRIEWPDPGLPIDQLNADHYWSFLTDHLGMAVVPFLRWMQEREVYHGQEACDLLRSAVHGAFDTDTFNFYCDTCHRLYIKSKFSKSGTALCSHRYVESIPF